MGWGAPRSWTTPSQWGRSLRARFEEAPVQDEDDMRRAFWIMSGLVSFCLTLWLAEAFQPAAIPPGGDPGNWFATSFAYTGHPYASQLVPFGYPPLLFPILGGFVALGGGPIGGARIFAPVLLLALGLSTAWLARQVVSNGLLGFLVVAFLLADPSLLAMFFWGAYPNLLAFVFMNLALVGLLRAGRGAPSSGAFQFWVFFSATVLTHSLAGLVLAGTAAGFIALSFTVPVPASPAVLAAARSGELDSSPVGSRALLRSPGASSGMLFFLLTVGGFYLGTYALHVPHPYYFQTGSAAFSLSSVGSALQALLPHVYFGHTTLTYLVGGIVVVLLAGFALVRDRRPQWITPAALLVVCWVLSTSILLLVGIALQIVTDYGRFGFFFLTPVALGCGYLLERAWVRDPAARGGPAPSPHPTDGAAVRRSRSALAPARARLGITALIAIALFVVLLVDGTAPSIARNERSFTGPTHDAQFLAAVRAIQGSGIVGGTMTVAGADKWVRALTGANAYAAYATPAYLFYPSQEVDSALTYDALTGRCVVSNGFVEASVRGFLPSDLDGLPDYLAFSPEGARPVLRLLPASVSVTLAGPTGGGNVTENLTGAPLVSLPTSATAGTMQIVFDGPSAIVEINVTMANGAPGAAIEVSALAVGNAQLRALSFALEPPLGAVGFAWSTGAPGQFGWKLLNTGHPEPTQGNVTPVGALADVTNDAAGGGGAAIGITVRSSNASGAAALSAAVALSTPSAQPYLSPLPSVVDTPAVWKSLGVRFILMRNGTDIASPLVAAADESTYLEAEYGLPVLYQNPEWTVLLVPTGLPYL